MDIDTYYKKRAYSGMSSSRRRAIIKLLGKPQNKKILDVGCGTGYLGREIKKLGENKVIGIDISAKAIEEAKKVLDEVFILNIEKDELPFTVSTFDIVILTDVLEHLYNPEAVLLKLRKYLKKNGFLIITVPNFSFIRTRFKVLFGNFEYQDKGLLERGHIRFFTKKTLLKLLEKTEFKILKFEPIYHARFTKLRISIKVISTLFATQFAVKAKK